ncbi:FAD-dependent oxidoreductase [bacterium]|jgi:thioredoxin reductase (NADPH)|nr:FAD-dependent oxidoreductase [bacterium]
MNFYPIIVVGGGVSGASAAMYAARFNLKTLVFAEQPGGLITTTHLVENYPGIKSISGPKMGMTFLEHAKETGAEFKYETIVEAQKVKIPEGNEYAGVDGFRVATKSDEYFCLTLVLATGTEHKHLNIPGEQEYKNKGVSYCALCDAGFFKEKTVAIVGGGDTSAIDANILSQQCSKVYVLVRKDYMKAEPVNLKRIEDDPKVEIIYNTEVTTIEGAAEKMTHVMLKDGSKMDLDGLFVAIGWNTKSELAKQLGAELNARNEIIINREAETSIPGLYAAGDVTDAHFKQAIIGAAEGVYASVQAFNYIQSLKPST